MGDEPITTEARRLVREHNGLPDHYSGVICWVNLDTGEVGEPYARYAASQPPIEWRREHRQALMRIGHGKLTQRAAQRFLTSLGEEE